MNDSKRDRLFPILRCTSCGAAPLDSSPAGVRCRSCNVTYPLVDGAINFLNDATSTAYRIEDTENVSDHPFDGNALELIRSAERVGGLILDCGSGFKADAFDHVVQLEIVNYPNTDILAVNQRLPFVDDAFDAVFSLNVLEHVDDPFESAREITRVLRPGGLLYVDIPFLQPEHGYPNHYFNATRQGLRRLFPALHSLGHRVPLSGHPIFALWHISHIYKEGLPESLREDFLALTFGELLGRTELSWLEDPLCTDVGMDAQWLIASTTQAVLQKEPVSGVPPRLDVVVELLPGFRDAGGALDRPLPGEPPGAPDLDPPIGIRQSLRNALRRR